jgi:two-component system NtrC family sensor kinase
MPDTVRILCVDDEINMLNVIRRQLCDLDVQVHVALSADEGLRFLRRTHPVHVVVSDYRMPGMNGIEFLTCVSREWPEVSRIMLSGFADTEAVNQALEQQKLFAFLHKPWKASELQAIIAEAVALSLAGYDTKLASGSSRGSICRNQKEEHNS